jgi:hypothetical protein
MRVRLQYKTNERKIWNTGLLFGRESQPVLTFAFEAVPSSMPPEKSDYFSSYSIESTVRKPDCASGEHALKRKQEERFSHSGQIDADPEAWGEFR